MFKATDKKNFDFFFQETFFATFKIFQNFNFLNLLKKDRIKKLVDYK